MKNSLAVVLPFREKKKKILVQLVLCCSIVAVASLLFTKYQVFFAISSFIYYSFMLDVILFFGNHIQRGILSCTVCRHQSNDIDCT